MAGEKGTAATAPRARTAGLERLERALVVLVALHSVAVGVSLLLATEWGARHGGFPAVTPLFFPRQAGAFHLVVATAYLVEYFHYRGVLLLVTTKAIAAVFLFLTSASDPVPWIVPREIHPTPVHWRKAPSALAR